MKAKNAAAKLEPGVVTEVLLSALHPDPDQPRKVFSEASLLSLADNIRERGVTVPLLVRNVGGSTGLMIVDGERRWRAAQLAKLKTVPALLVDTREEGQLRLDQVSVNQLREQLKSMELARVLRGLRDAGKTTNEIAATLAKQGHAAMTPASIDELAELIALPQWAQDMVNADQLKPKHAGSLLPVLERPKVGTYLEKEMKRAVGYRGELLGNDVRRACQEALLRAGAVDLARVESWHSDAVHFAWKTRCKGCEHLQRWGDGAFCMSRKRFEEHNQEAKDAGLLPGGRTPQKKAEPKTGSKVAEKEDAAKAEQRERSLTEKARDYLRARLCVALIEEIQKRPVMARVYVLWRALKNPGSYGTRGARPIDAEIPAEYRSIEQLAGALSNDDLLRAESAAARNIVNELPWRETHALARLLWGEDLHTVWNLDREFLGLFRKSELVHLAQLHQCDLPEGRRSWDALKGDEIKNAMLAQHEKLLRPAILADLYQGDIEPPYKPWRPGGDEDEDDDFQNDEERDAA